MPRTIKLFGKNRKPKKRQDGRWELRYYQNGKQYSVYDKTQNDCIEKFKKEYQENANNKFTEIKITTLNEWLDIWYNTYKVHNLKQSSLESIIYSRKKYIDQTIGLMQIKKIKALHIQETLNNIQGSRQRQIVKNHLSNVFKYAIKNNIIKDNPMNGVEVKHRTQHKEILTISQQKQLLEIITDIEFKTLIECYLQTGMRRNEALNLKITDIDKNRKTLKIKGTKTENSIREVPLNQTLINKMLSISKNNKIFNFRSQEVSKKFKAICDKLSFKNITVHSLRHTFATNCLQAGLPMKLVQYFLGHSSITLTSDLYTHITDEIIQKELTKLNKLFDPNFDPNFEKS